eukprot:jgi/Botrbrau1/3730/Bobra.0363s0015.1
MNANWVRVSPECIVNGSGTSGVKDGRSSHSLTSVGDVLYLTGGENVPRVPIGTEMYKLDLNAQDWQKLQVFGDAPSPRVAHGAAALGRIIYIFGGRSGIDMGEGALDDFFSFDTSTRTWARIVTEAGPPARSYHAMATDTRTGKVYVFGGCGAGSSGRLNDLWEFDPAAATWTRLPSCAEIKGRGGAGVAVDANAAQLFVVGGFAGHELGDVYRFDFRAATWDSISTPKGPLRPRSMFGGAHVIGQHLVVTCGEVDPSDKGHEGAGKYVSDTCVLDLGDVEQGWRTLAPTGDAPEPRGWFAAAPVGGSLYVHGGIAESGKRLQTLYRLDIGPA